MTALIIYGSNVASTTLGTADMLATTNGGTEVNTVTIAPSGNGYMEILAAGGTGTLNASLPAPSGKGWLLDATTLENTTITGNWSASLALADTTGGGPVTSIVVRAYKRSASNSYTAIGTLTTSSPTLSTSRTVYNFSAVAFTTTSFVGGDKLYLDLFVQATGWSGDHIAVYLSNSASTGITSDLQITTPGYITTPASSIVKTNVGLNLLRDGVSGAQNPKITYVSIGTSNTTPTATDTQLGAEIFRKAVTTYTNGATGELLTACYIAPGDIVGVDIEEIGFWGGNATGAANSGVLIAHGLYSHNSKTLLESITIQLDEIFS